MIDKHGMIVECAYNQLEHRLNNYKSTVDKNKKEEYMFKAFNEFLNNLKN